MKGYIFVSPGADPGLGLKLDDPIFGRRATMGACRPDLRRRVQIGDQIFVISGSQKGVSQYVIGGFVVDQKLHAYDAYDRFPERRLKMVGDIKHGNIIIDESRRKHPLDHHPLKNFDRRLENYLVGRDEIRIEKPPEIEIARDRSLAILREIFGKRHARKIQNVIGRGARMDAGQLNELRAAMQQIKADAIRGPASRVS